MVFEGCGNYGNTKISQSEILFGTVVSGKSHLEIRGFEKHIKNGESDVTNRKSNLQAGLHQAPSHYVLKNMTERVETQ